MHSVIQKFLTLVPILRKTSVITFSFGTRTSFLNSSNVVCCSRPVGNPLSHSRASLVAQMVKNLPIFWETWFNPWVEKIPLRREWTLTPVFLPGKFHGQMSLVGYNPWTVKESDKTEHAHAHAVPASYQLRHQLTATSPPETRRKTASLIPVQSAEFWANKRCIVWSNNVLGWFVMEQRITWVSQVSQW